MKFCNKHGNKLVSHITICERDKNTLKFKKIRTVCPVCEQIFKRYVLFEKVSKLDDDITYFRDKLIESLAVPSRLFNID